VPYEEVDAGFVLDPVPRNCASTIGIRWLMKSGQSEVDHASIEDRHADCSEVPHTRFLRNRVT